MEWKWTKGEPYERSRRIFKNENYENGGNGENRENDEKFSKDIETSAYSSALNHDENTWDMLNQDHMKDINKREDLDFKIADRGPVQQIGNNPFLGQNNYVEDIATRDKFLKPVNTTQGRTKATNNSSGQTVDAYGM